MRKVIITILGLFLPALVSAHGVGQVYTLPIPLKYYLSAAGLAVAFSFFLFAIFTNNQKEYLVKEKVFHLSWVRIFVNLCRIAILLFIGLAIILGIFTNSNFTPVFFWVYFLIGFGVLSVMVGNLWYKINPWKTLYNLLISAKDQKASKTISPWVGVSLLVGVFWLELASGVSFKPQIIGFVLLLYTFANLILARVYSNWFTEGEVFAVYFGYIGKLAYLNIGQDSKSIIYSPLRLRLQQTVGSWPNLALACLLLAGTSYDSFKETVIWFNWLKYLHFSVVYLRIPNTIGLFLSPLPFLILYLIAVWIMTKLVGNKQDWKQSSKLFVFSLIPIAFGYTLAHNFSLAIITATKIILSAKVIWFIEIGFVVIAHILGTWYAHVLAMNNFPDTKTVLKSQYPMLVLMVCFTVLTLWLLSQPLVVGK